MKNKWLTNRTAILLCLAAAFIVFFAALPTPASAVNFATTSPWVGSVASFILGDKGTVRNIAVLNASGGTARSGSARASEHVIALDAKDAKRFGFGPNNPRLHLLYENMPMTDAEFVRGFFDPAMLPFVAQKVMKAITDADPKRYSYYQRRLAEFQSRIESTQEIGRYLLVNIHILDLTGAQGYWIRAVTRTAVRPPEKVWSGWLNGDSRSLKAAVDEAARRGWLVLVDSWTPPQIRSSVLTSDKRLTLPLPAAGQDFFVYLHNIFLTIRDRAKAPATKK